MSRDSRVRPFYNECPPNENYLKYFPDEDVPEVKDRSARSSCLRIGAWLVIKKVIEEYRLTDILSKYISMKDLGLVMDKDVNE